MYTAKRGGQDTNNLILHQSVADGGGGYSIKNVVKCGGIGEAYTGVHCCWGV